jgi:hypothetical protein
MSLDKVRCLAAKNAMRFNPSHRYLVPYDVHVDHVAWSDSDQLAVLSGYDDAPEGIDSAWRAAARGARSVLQQCRCDERTLVNRGHRVPAFSKIVKALLTAALAPSNTSGLPEAWASDQARTRTRTAPSSSVVIPVRSTIALRLA